MRLPVSQMRTGWRHWGRVWHVGERIERILVGVFKHEKDSGKEELGLTWSISEDKASNMYLCSGIRCDLLFPQTWFKLRLESDSTRSSCTGKALRWGGGTWRCHKTPRFCFYAILYLPANQRSRCGWRRSKQNMDTTVSFSINPTQSLLTGS